MASPLLIFPLYRLSRRVVSRSPDPPWAAQPWGATSPIDSRRNAAAFHRVADGATDTYSAHKRVF